MKKEVKIIIIVVIIITLGIVAWQIFKLKEKGKEETVGGENATQQNITASSSQTFQINCSELSLSIEKVDCLENVTEISVSVSRGNDSLGEGELTVYATDKEDTTKLNKVNFSASNTARVNIGNIEVGEKTKITVEFEIEKEGKKAFCPGPIKEYKCTGAVEVDEGEKIEFPGPSGTIKVTDQRNDAGGYFCNNTETPTHSIRLHTYKVINGVKNFSASYIESEKINNFCSNYVDVGEGMRYDIKWEWQAVEGIDGYRIYQYYSYNETKIEYNYYIDLLNTSTKLVDTGFGLWKQEIK